MGSFSSEQDALKCHILFIWFTVSPMRVMYYLACEPQTYFRREATTGNTSSVRRFMYHHIRCKWLMISNSRPLSERASKQEGCYWGEMIHIGSFLVFLTICVLKLYKFCVFKKNGWKSWTLARLKRLCGGEWHKTIRNWGPLEMLSIAKVIKINTPLHPSFRI